MKSYVLPRSLISFPIFLLPCSFSLYPSPSPSHPSSLCKICSFPLLRNPNPNPNPFIPIPNLARGCLLGCRRGCPEVIHGCLRGLGSEL
ncbi:hypothetical protein I3843_01G039700 [Carya illinoinensis]|nr:hypothetical protein I3843_01G039100 [Carya illinoinensis]KAG7994113.1 hypothetical protein I3843_01G039700 [Carya illinoinensis]